MYDFNGIIEFLHSVSSGIDPTTGEVFDRRDMYQNAEIYEAVKDIYLYSIGRKKPASKNLLNLPAQKIFDELKAWRRDKAEELNLPPYIIFSDKELWSIAEGDVCSKEQLMLVKGISNYKYEAYAEEVFEIIHDYIDRE